MKISDFDKRLETIYAQIAITEDKINEIDAVINKYELEKINLENKLNDLCQESETVEGEKFANECENGKHPVILWNEVPNYMRKDLQTMIDKHTEGLETEDAQKQGVIKAIEEFKTKYKFEKIEISHA